MGARANFLQTVRVYGWEPDPRQTVTRSWSNRERVQDPHAFTKPAAHGGTWHIYLDYRNRSSYHQNYDDTLRKVEVRHRDAEGEMDERSTLDRPDTFRTFIALWEATADPAKKNGGTLRDRATLLVADVDLVMWLAAEITHKHALEMKAESDRREQDRRERDRPLPLTPEGQKSWWEVKRSLYDAADHIYKSDGKSDLAALIVAARRALARVEDAVNADVQAQIEALEAVTA
ncbi:hypothetical protein BI081_gp070 [Mycobacterium phage Tonenili]|uniref:Uncharacterized protein n=1 Tax=Mycobacterium phage Tonenili TaxID=1891703 RepID=A0A1C9EH63_9CAUD|nr:hypothetical protein BI081_gp070 [Mycobacterium phage Tonenili]AON96821.1 hypothetical protein SEA_TONENILI_70 [Mycobacterium phage Tonenili]